MGFKFSSFAMAPILAASLYGAPSGPEDAAPLRFEVASVKVTADTRGIYSGRPSLSPGRIRWTARGLGLLHYAYGMELWRITTPPGEFIRTIYDVDATTFPQATDSQMRQMMRTLLSERFGMKANRVTREKVQGYALRVGKNGAKLTPAKEADGEGWVASHVLDATTNDIEGERATMAQLCSQLQRTLSTNVLDQTGLEGKYDFKFPYTTDADLPDSAAVLEAVKQIGLKLEKYVGPVEFVVISEISAKPTAN